MWTYSIGKEYQLVIRETISHKVDYNCLPAQHSSGCQCLLTFFCIYKEVQAIPARRLAQLVKFDPEPSSLQRVELDMRESTPELHEARPLPVRLLESMSFKISSRHSPRPDISFKACRHPLGGCCRTGGGIVEGPKTAVWTSRTRRKAH